MNRDPRQQMLHSMIILRRSAEQMNELYLACVYTQSIMRLCNEISRDRVRRAADGS
jgi:hypothetical protein